MNQEVSDLAGCRIFAKGGLEIFLEQEPRAPPGPLVHATISMPTSTPTMKIGHFTTEITAIY
jgi:hypothetical protein